MKNWWHKNPVDATAFVVIIDHTSQMNSLLERAMSVPPLPSSVSNLPYFQDDPDFRQFAEEHWAALYPPCEYPLRVGKRGDSLRVVLFGCWFIECGPNHAYIREGHFKQTGEESEEFNRYHVFDADQPINIEQTLKRHRSFDERFEFALAQEAKDEVKAFSTGSMEKRRDTWNFALDLVINEIRQLPTMRGLEQEVLAALKLDSEAIALARHFFGNAYANQVCAIHRNIDVFRRFEEASPALRRLLVLAFTDKLIDAQRDILGQLWSMMRLHKVSRGALKKIISLSQIELDAFRGWFRCEETFLFQIGVIRFLNWLPVKLSASGFALLVDTANWFGGIQEVLKAIERDGDKVFLPAFLRMLAREIVRREAANDFAGMEREYRLVLDWIIALGPTQDDRSGARITIDKQQENAGWRWLMNGQEEWHRTITQDGQNEWPEQSDKAISDYSWKSALGSYKEGAFRVVALTDSRSLRKESHRMRHCVRTYATRCYLGKCRIFSIEDAMSGKPLGTVELVNVYKGLHWQLGEVAGPRNMRVTAEVDEMAKRILKRYVEVIGGAPDGGGPGTSETML